MNKMPPRPPRELCSSEWHFRLGLVSPSLQQDYMFGMKQSEAVDKYFAEVKKYLQEVSVDEKE